MKRASLRLPCTSSSSRPAMKGSIRRLFEKITAPPPERPLHAVDRRIAKEYIKRRLLVLYPELRTDAEALERAYQELDLEPRGTLRRPEGEVKSFSLRVDDAITRPFEQR